MEEGKYETAARFAKIFFVITCPCFDEALLPADNCETFLKFCLCRLCIKVLSDDKKLWEDEVYKFARKHQLEVNILSFSIFLLGGSKLVWVIHDFIYFLYQAIAPYIPTKAVKLSSAIYEMVLYDFLKKDVKVFIQLH